MGQLKGTVSPYKLKLLLKIHKNRLEWHGKTLRGCYSCIVVFAIHSWLWLIETWGGL